MRKIMYALLIAATFTSLTACKGNSGDSAATQATTEATTQQTPETSLAAVNLADIHTAVKEAYGETYVPSMEYDEQAMSEVFGISKDLYESYIAEGPMMSVHVENFVAVQAKEGKGEEVESILSDYRETLLQESMQYPMNMPKLEASSVLRHGDYVFFVMLGSPTQEAEEQGEEAALESAKENNQIGITAINEFFK